MKKRILGAVAVIAFNMNVIADNNEFSALTMNNVAAYSSVGYEVFPKMQSLEKYHFGIQKTELRKN